MNKVTFYDPEGQETEFYVEEQTRLNGTDYLLVSDDPDGDANALILKDISEESDPEARYVPVEDADELEAVLRIFSEMMEETDIRM